MVREFFNIRCNNGPVIASAIHNGHELRPEIAQAFQLTGQEREREEDPHTAAWTDVADIQIVCNRSRFELDVNRSRDRAVYIKPGDAWGLKLYDREPPKSLISSSLKEYDDFYDNIGKIIEETISQYGNFVLLDLHSYNHRRNGAGRPAADPEGHPEVNIGTGTITGRKWRPLVERFIRDLSSYDFIGRKLDVRENVIFKGGYFPTWVNGKYGRDGCAIAIEFKKFWMDEWSGEVYNKEYEAISFALKSAVTGLREELEKIKKTGTGEE